jgi:hypothetical protein
MYLSRSLTFGLMAAMVVLLVNVWTALDVPPRASAPLAAMQEPISVVDIAPGVDPAALATLVRLRADERVIAVDDQPVANDLAAGAAIARRSPGSRRFLDLTVASAAGSRRVLVLVH